MDERGPNSDFVFRPDEGGLILVDKPLGWTSFDAVKKIRGAMRSIVRRRGFKIGHGWRPGDSGVDASLAIADFQPKQHKFGDGFRFLA